MASKQFQVRFPVIVSSGSKHSRFFEQDVVLSVSAKSGADALKKVEAILSQQLIQKTKTNG
jgi:hypothetical protein